MLRPGAFSVPSEREATSERRRSRRRASRRFAHGERERERDALVPVSHGVGMEASCESAERDELRPRVLGNVVKIIIKAVTTPYYLFVRLTRVPTTPRTTVQGLVLFLRKSRSIGPVRSEFTRLRVSSRIPIAVDNRRASSISYRTYIYISR